jgi:hypothetical protein
MLKRVSFPTLLVTWIAAVALCVVAAFSGSARAQDLGSRLPSGTHPLLHDSMPPGEIGAIQLHRKPELRGVWQAVEIKGPKGLKVAMADAGQFTDNLAESRIAVVVGYPYRLRITGIPFEEDAALYPTLEVIDRIHPPAEREHRFPIPIELDEDDLAEAIKGEMVMKVIYLEDNEIADPVDTAGRPQRVLDVRPGQDALRTADRLGRPVAILRIGSRVPNVSEGQDWDNFLYGCPAWTTIKPIPTKQMLIEQGKWPASAKSGSISDRR